MAIRVKARSGESVEGLMRRFKKLCEKEGLTKDVRRKEFYEKPSERARRDAMVGLRVALGRLQTAAGPDARSTATAQHLGARNPHWTGAWTCACQGPCEKSGSPRCHPHRVHTR